MFCTLLQVTEILSSWMTDEGRQTMTTKEVLMQRDGMSETEALDLMNDTRSDIYDAIANGDFDLAENIMYGDLGLEMDYIFDLLI